MNRIIVEKIISDFFDRCEGLFSREYEPMVIDVINKSIENGGMSEGVLCSYPEFPLSGESWLDWTVGTKRGFAYEYDLSKRGTANPGKAVSYRDVTDEEKLRQIGAGAYYKGLNDRMAKAPKEITFGYANNFSGRSHSVFRMGTYYRGDMNPDSFLSALETLGYKSIPGSMEEMLDKIFSVYPDFEVLEVGLNILPDGSFADGIGIFFPVPNKKRGVPNTPLAESGYGSFINLLSKEGIIDKRCQRAVDVSYNMKYMPGAFCEDMFVVSNVFRSIKLSWKAGDMQLAKMYYNFTMYNH